MKTNKPLIRKCLFLAQIIIITVCVLILVLQNFGILSPIWIMLMAALLFLSMINFIMLVYIDRNSEIKKAEFKPIYYLPIVIIIIYGIIRIFLID